MVLTFSTAVCAQDLVEHFRQVDCGGRVLTAMTGSAPTAPEVVDFLRDALLIPITEGYGSTGVALPCATLCGATAWVFDASPCSLWRCTPLPVVPPLQTTMQLRMHGKLRQCCVRTEAGLMARDGALNDDVLAWKLVDVPELGVPPPSCSPAALWLGSPYTVLTGVLNHACRLPHHQSAFPPGLCPLLLR